MSSSSVDNKIVAIAEHQGEYQAIIDRLSNSFNQAILTSSQEFLETIVKTMGVRAYRVVKIADRNKLKVLLKGPKQTNIKWNILEESLIQHLKTGKTRSELIKIPEGFGSHNLLLSRLSAYSHEDDWFCAIVFIGRKRPPVRDASPGFLTRDFIITEKMADWYREMERGILETSTTNQPIWWLTSFRNSLSYYLGPRVTLTIRDDDLVISGITPRKELGNLATQDIAEMCIISLSGWHITEQILLEKTNSLPTQRGMVDEFRIIVQKFPVYGRKISVRQLPLGTEAESFIPIGWWWSTEVKDINVSNEDAVSIAAEKERAIQPDVPDLSARLVKTVIWPDTKGIVAHEVQIISQLGLSVTYFINAYDGSIIVKRQDVCV
jgi:hypothetical protein